VARARGSWRSFAGVYTGVVSWARRRDEEEQSQQPPPVALGLRQRVVHQVDDDRRDRGGNLNGRESAGSIARADRPKLPATSRTGASRTPDLGRGAHYARVISGDLAPHSAGYPLARRGEGAGVIGWVASVVEPALRAPALRGGERAPGVACARRMGTRSGTRLPRGACLRDCGSRSRRRRGVQREDPRRRHLTPGLVRGAVTTTTSRSYATGKRRSWSTPSGPTGEWSPTGNPADRSRRIDNLIRRVDHSADLPGVVQVSGSNLFHAESRSRRIAG
jgi:hypothetical protein